jgi:hypothetical protein
MLAGAPSPEGIALNAWLSVRMSADRAGIATAARASTDDSRTQKLRGNRIANLVIGQRVP